VNLKNGPTRFVLALEIERLFARLQTSVALSGMKDPLKSFLGMLI